MLKKLGLLIASSLIAVLLAEVLFRVLDLAPTRDVYTVTEQQFRSIPGIYEPGQDFTSDEIAALPYHTTINRHGYRGAEFPLAKPTGEFRIFVAGDSLTYGDFVNDDQTLPANLERLFQAKCPSVRVVNAGLRGGTILGEAELIKRGLVLSPDLVVLVFHENDITDLSAPLWLALERNREQKSRLPMSVIYPLFRGTAIWNVALRTAGAIQANRKARIATPDAKKGDGGSSEVESLKAQYSERLKALSQMLEELKIPFGFIAFPGHQALDGNNISSELSEWAHRTAVADGIWTIDLLQELRSTGIDKRQLYLLPHDGHPSPRGQELAATFLHEGLSNHAALAQVCGR